MTTPLLVAQLIQQQVARLDLGGEATPLTSLQIQRLLYYAQGYSLASRDIPLFVEEIEAWECGPVVPSLHHALAQYGGEPLPSLSGDLGAGGATPLSKEEMDLIEEVVRLYGQFSCWKLREMVRAQQPWVESYSPERQNQIPKETLRIFFANFMLDPWLCEPLTDEERQTLRAGRDSFRDW